LSGAARKWHCCEKTWVNHFLETPTGTPGRLGMEKDDIVDKGKQSTGRIDSPLFSR
jgi:hypothetical protein